MENLHINKRMGNANFTHAEKAMTANMKQAGGWRLVCRVCKHAADFDHKGPMKDAAREHLAAHGLSHGE